MHSSAILFLVLSALVSSQLVTIVVTSYTSTLPHLPSSTSEYASTYTTVVLSGLSTTTVDVMPPSTSASNTTEAKTDTGATTSTSAELNPDASSYISSLLSAETSSASLSTNAITSSTSVTELLSTQPGGPLISPSQPVTYSAFPTTASAISTTTVEVLSGMTTTTVMPSGDSATTSAGNPVYTGAAAGSSVLRCGEQVWWSIGAVILGGLMGV